MCKITHITSNGMAIHQSTPRRLFPFFRFITTTRHSHNQLPPMRFTNLIIRTIIFIETQAKSATARYGQRRTRNTNIFPITTFLMHIISTKQALSEFTLWFYVNLDKILLRFFHFAFRSWFQFCFFFSFFFFYSHDFQKEFSILHNPQQSQVVNDLCSDVFSCALVKIGNKQSKRWATTATAALEWSDFDRNLFAN